ncbi:MAG: bifunctional oligoribonuclease/PAP phosphatase NrnA [Candidatus Gracilibacteria bacterium]|nr:bifunctional oligoribonuclease/PAP phosphatase NrnA [Candidatus Gracilibacteria bacterium]
MNPSPTLSLEKAELQKLKDFLGGKPSLTILTHANPDGDAVGSALGLFWALKPLGFKLTLACLDPISPAFQFLAGSGEFQTDFDLESSEGLVFLDCGEKRMTRFEDSKPDLFDPKRTIINLDHHPTNDSFGDINFVLPKASSTAEIVTSLLEALELPLTPEISSALLLGLYTDTGSFQHQNTTPSAYAAAAKLVRAGGNISKIAKHVFFSNEFKKFKLWGKVLNNLHVTEDGAAIVGVYKKDYESVGATRADLNGVVDLINSMPESRYTVMLSEDEKGNVKASLRTRNEDVDVRALAEKFGGGGHVKASGFTIPRGHLQKEVKWKIVQE